MMKSEIGVGLLVLACLLSCASADFICGNRACNSSCKANYSSRCEPARACWSGLCTYLCSRGSYPTTAGCCVYRETKDDCSCKCYNVTDSKPFSPNIKEYVNEYYKDILGKSLCAGSYASKWCDDFDLICCPKNMTARCQCVKSSSGYRTKCYCQELK